MNPYDLAGLLSKAFAARAEWFDSRHQAAFRLFNGFYEGEPNLLVDIYAATAVLYNYADVPFEGAAAIRTAMEVIRVNLTMNQDASLYLDTRKLRKWALEHLDGKTVLNTFAYTGSLGVAARAGGAARVLQVDRSQDFLNVAKDSYTLNGFPIEKRDFLAEDFSQPSAASSAKAHRSTAFSSTRRFFRSRDAARLTWRARASG